MSNIYLTTVTGHIVIHLCNCTVTPGGDKLKSLILFYLNPSYYLIIMKYFRIIPK